MTLIMLLLMIVMVATLSVVSPVSPPGEKNNHNNNTKREIRTPSVEPSATSNRVCTEHFLSKDFLRGKKNALFVFWIRISNCSVMFSRLFSPSCRGWQM